MFCFSILETVSIDLSFNSFTGDIPRLPTGLVQLIINYSLFSGGFTDASFTGLGDLNYVEMSFNSFGASIPPVWSSLASLEQVFMEDAGLTGNLDFLIGMPVIFQLWIDKNPSLSGTLPTEVGQLATLASFSLTENDLFGPIPSEMGNIAAMRRLWLYSNRLSGAIPSELANMRAIELLRLEDNNFSGSMPTEICDLANDSFTVLSVLGSTCQADFSQCAADCCDCCSVAECDNLAL